MSRYIPIVDPALLIKANLKAEAHQRGRYILIFDHEDLTEIAEGTSLEQVIAKKYEQLLLI